VGNKVSGAGDGQMAKKGLLYRATSNFLIGGNFPFLSTVVGPAFIAFETLTLAAGVDLAFVPN